jgi:hypothetical protein
MIGNLDSIGDLIGGQPYLSLAVVLGIVAASFIVLAAVERRNAARRLMNNKPQGEFDLRSRDT